MACTSGEGMSRVSGRGHPVVCREKRGWVVPNVPVPDDGAHLGCLRLEVFAVGEDFMLVELERKVIVSMADPDPSGLVPPPLFIEQEKRVLPAASLMLSGIGVGVRSPGAVKSSAVALG